MTAETEREAIVRWLRKQSRMRANERIAKLHWLQTEKLADAIERGDHLPRSSEG